MNNPFIHIVPGGHVFWGRCFRLLAVLACIAKAPAAEEDNVAGSFVLAPSERLREFAYALERSGIDLPFDEASRRAGGAAVLGMGRWAQKMMNELPGIPFPPKIVGIARGNFEELAKRPWPGRVSIVSADDYERTVLRDPMIKSVVITTPYPTHFELVKQALEAGKNVLCEKPFTPTLAEAEELVRLAEEKDLVLALGYEYLYHPDLYALRDFLQRKGAGYLLEIEIFMQNPPIRERFDDSMNVIEDLAGHPLSMLQRILGVRGVRNLTRILINEKAQLGLVYGTTNVRIHLARDAAAQKRVLVLKGTEFDVELDYDRGVFSVRDREGEPVPEDDPRYPPEFREKDPERSGTLRGEFMDFFTALIRRENPENSARRMLWITRTLKRIEAIPEDARDALPVMSSPHLKSLLPFDRVVDAIRGKPVKRYPAKVEFYVGLRCPKRCFFCYRNVSGRVEAYDEEMQAGLKTLSPQEYARIVHECADHGTRYFYVSGGVEPFDDIEGTRAIIEAAASRGAKVFLFSSGDKVAPDSSWDTPLPKEFLGLIPSILKTARFRVSLHAARWKTYARMMRCAHAQRVFDYTLTRLRALVDARRESGSKTVLGISMLLTPVNFREMIEVADLAADIGLDTLDLTLDYADIAQYFSEAEEGELLDLVQALHTRVREGRYPGLAVRLPDCFVPFGEYVIKTNYHLPGKQAEYSDRGIFPFELTIDPFGKLWNTTTAANPGMRKLGWARGQNLGTISGERPGEIREVLDRHLARGTRFEYGSTNPLVRQMLIYMKRMERAVSGEVEEVELEPREWPEDFARMVRIFSRRAEETVRGEGREVFAVREVLADPWHGMFALRLRVDGLEEAVFLKRIMGSEKRAYYDLYVGSDFEVARHRGGVFLEFDPEGGIGSFRLDIAAERDTLPGGESLRSRVSRVLARETRTMEERLQVPRDVDRNTYWAKAFKNLFENPEAHPAGREAFERFGELGGHAWSGGSDELVLVFPDSENDLNLLGRRLERAFSPYGFLVFANRHTNLRVRGFFVADGETCIELIGKPGLDLDAARAAWKNGFDAFLQQEADALSGPPAHRVTPGNAA